MSRNVPLGARGERHVEIVLAEVLDPDRGGRRDRVRDHTVDGPERIDRGGDQCEVRVAIGGIGGARDVWCTQLIELRGQFVERRGTAGRHDEPSAGAGQVPGDPAPDTSARAGDHDDALGEIVGWPAHATTPVHSAPVITPVTIGRSWADAMPGTAATTAGMALSGRMKVAKLSPRMLLPRPCISMSTV
jgi:hypothetical protein